MKNFCITFFVFFIIIATAVFVSGYSAEKSGDAAEYLRIHVRANSNSEEDQSVKYKVKDAVVEYITPLAASCRTKDDAIALINANIAGIEGVCEDVLEENGYFYGASAEVREENFPTRVYGDLTLAEGCIGGTGAGRHVGWFFFPAAVLHLLFAGRGIPLDYTRHNFRLF